MTENQNANYLLFHVKKPLDQIILNDKQCKLFVELGLGDLDEISEIPSDLFFSRTIPLPCFDLVIHSKGVMNFRFMLTDDYVLNKENATIPMVTFLFDKNTEKPEMTWFIRIEKGNNHLQFSGGIVSNDSYINLAKINTADFEAWEHQTVWSTMCVWYGIQIALLHPVVKEVFSKPKTVAIDDTQRKLGKNKKNYKRIF